jgi:hypothetical protein
MLSQQVLLLLASFTVAIASPPYTLGGMTLGTRIAPIAAAHPDAVRYPRSRGFLWSWKGAEGGAFDVYTDENGIITSIRFTADERELGSIDLPCAGKFPIDDSHVNLEFAIDPKVCVPGATGVYELPDHSILDVEFDGPADGQLHGAFWYRP